MGHIIVVIFCAFNWHIITSFINCFTPIEPLLDDFLVVTDSLDNRLYQVDVATSKVHALPSIRTENEVPEGVSYDPVAQTVYWVDKKQKQIRRLNLMTRTEELFLTLSTRQYTSHENK